MVHQFFHGRSKLTMTAILDWTNFEHTMVCPISFELMTDPVILNTGISYQRAHISAWLQNHTACPVTNQNVTTLQPNITLRNAVEEFMTIQPLLNEALTSAASVTSAPAPAPVVVQSETVVAYCRDDVRNVELPIGSYFLSLQCVNLSFPNVSFGKVHWDIFRLTTLDAIRSGDCEVRKATSNDTSVCLVYIDVTEPCTLTMRFKCAHWFSDIFPWGQTRIAFTVTRRS